MINNTRKEKPKKSKKKYKRILPVAILCILVIMISSVIFQFTLTYSNIHEQYDAQIDNIIDNCNEMSNYYNKTSKDYMKCNVAALEGIAYFLDHGDKKKAESDFKAYIEKLDFLYAAYYVNDQKQILFEYNEDVFDEEENVDFSESQLDSLFRNTGDKTHSVDVGDFIYTSMRYQKGYIIFKDYDRSMEKSLGNQGNWKILLQNVWIGDHGFFGVINEKDNGIIYSKDESLIGEKVSDLLGNTVSGEYRIYQVGKKIFLGKKYPYNNSGVQLVALTPLDQVVLSCLHGTKILEIISIAIIALMILYALCLRNYNLEEKEEKRFFRRYFLVEHYKRFTVLILIAELVLFISSFLLLNIFSITEQANTLQENSNRSIQVLDEYNMFLEVQDFQPKTTNFAKTHLIERYLSRYPKQCNKKILTELSEIFDVKYISVFDAEGHTVSTSAPYDHLSLLDNKKSPFYEFRKVLMGREELDVKADKDYLGENITYYGVARRDANEVANGIVAISQEIYNEYTSEALNQSLLNMCGGEGAFLFMVDKDKNITFYPEKDYIGKNISELGISDKVLKTDENDFLTLGGKSYLSAVAKNADGYVLSVIPFHWYDRSVLIRSLIAVLLLIPLSLWTLYAGLGNRYSYLTGTDYKGNEYIPPKREWFGIIRKLMDWNYAKRKKAEDSEENISVNNRAEIQFFWILKMLIYAISFVLVLKYMFYNDNGNTQSVLHYIMSGRWGKSINILSMIANSCLLMIAYTFISLSILFLQTIAHFLNAKGKTICRLLSSVVKYLGACACFYQITTNVGIDAKTTLASLGIVAMALGLGAQELIKDMIAGIFILFEGNYQVGDMLLIGTERYWVKAIGIRTTKLEAYGQIKIINNSQMTSVVNIQSSSTEVSIELKISNDHSVSEIEEIMNTELSQFEKAYSSDVTPPFYGGVTHIDKNGVTILIKAYCPIHKENKVRRKMNRQIIMICEKNNLQLL